MIYSQKQMITKRDRYNNALRTKWPYKKHTHASEQQIYESRGRLGRKLRVMGVNTAPRHLAQYNAAKRLSKRVTSGYSRWKTGG